MIVFDVDGTLVDGETEDWASFEESFKQVTGITLDTAFYDRLAEVTARAIVHQVLVGYTVQAITEAERAICSEHLRRLKRAHERSPGALRPTKGALELLSQLREAGIPVGIATGGWMETITFRLSAAGIPYQGLPLATSSQYFSRAEIIAASIKAGGRQIGEAIYVGDGLWDLRAARKLGIPFIGVGPRREKLRNAGARYTLADLSPPGFLSLVEAINKTNPAAGAQQKGGQV